MKFRQFVLHLSCNISCIILAVAVISIFPIVSGKNATSQGVFEFGNPAIFVTSADQDFHPYRLVETVDYSYIENEYIIYNPKKSEETTLKMMMYESGTASDIVLQNLGKEQYWAFVNSTGVLPSMTILNTTTKETYQFYTVPENTVEYHTNFSMGFETTETVPPIDVYFEIPAESRSFKARKTLINYYSCGFLRWKWYKDEKTDRYDYVSMKEKFDIYSKNEKTYKGDWAEFQHVDNPCLPDFFLIYVLAKKKSGGTDDPHHVFLNMPAFNLKDESSFFYDLSTLLCTNPDDISECGKVDDVVLTNDHVVVLSHKGLYISESMNVSTSDPLERDTLPRMNFDLVNPCAAYKQNIGDDCFADGVELKLHFIPVCSLEQGPNYFDTLILSIKIKDPSTSENFKFTVLYSYTPYKQWFPLFIGASVYNKVNIIDDIVGIIFNHQLLHFDITALFKIVNSTATYGRRFVLNIPKDSHRGHSVLSNDFNNGFPDFTFSESFKIKEIDINPATMDILFLGSELWIAENAGPFVYLSLGSLGKYLDTATNETLEHSITHCNFNHPDRYFVCTNAIRDELFVGRTAYQYSLVNVKLNYNEQLKQTIGLNSKYRLPNMLAPIIQKALITVSFSGNVLIWYMYDATDINDILTKTDSVCEKAAPGGVVNDPSLSAFQAIGGEGYEGEIGEQNYQYCVNYRWEELRNSKPPYRVAPKLGSSPAVYSMVSLNPQTFEPNRLPTEGPLTPYFIDSTTAIVFEGRVPGAEQSQIHYIDVVNIGEKVQCPLKTLADTEKEGVREPVDDIGSASTAHGKGKIKAHEKYRCELYVRHIKNVGNFLPDFRLAMYVSILKSIPMDPIDRALTVVIEKQSNLAIITLNVTTGTFKFDLIMTGQSIYIPGHFSILLKGYPDEATKETSMWGVATVFETKERKEELKANETWLINLSTCKYRKQRYLQDEWERYNRSTSAAKLAESMNREHLRQRNVKANWNKDRKRLGLKEPYTSAALLRPVDVPVPPKLPEPANDTKVPDEVEACDLDFKTITKDFGLPWISGDGGCHHILVLEDNPVLKSHGGLISLDRLDSISFIVKIRPIDELGIQMLYRPMIVISNSNPDVLTVDKIFSRAEGYQLMKVNLRAKGIEKGVSTVIVRSVVASIACDTPSSLTFVVVTHRIPGRSLRVNYPIPICNYGKKSGRRVQPDSPNCIPYKDVLDSSKKEITRNKQVIFSTLPVNYRPPSHRGVEIPLSENIYNSDPSQEAYKDWYQVSKDTRAYGSKFCAQKASREECNCKDSDKMQEDPIYSDCKEKVYTVKRAKGVPIVVDYDPVMRDEDQVPDFPPDVHELFVHIEEINGRKEFAVTDQYSNCSDSTCNQLLKEINNEPALNGGKKFLDGKTLEFTLYGTGLFHFKVGLGKFDTVDEVTGYFTLFSEANDLNDIKMMAIMFLTLTLCFGLLFFGFLRVRRRLTAHLPYNDPCAAKEKIE